MPQGLSYVPKATSLSNLYIRNIMPDDMSIPLLAHRALSGWGFTLFTLVRGMGILGRCAGPYLCSYYPHCATYGGADEPHH
jgi:hypothetical protein